MDSLVSSASFRARVPGNTRTPYSSSTTTTVHYYSNLLGEPKAGERSE